MKVKFTLGKHQNQMLIYEVIVVVTIDLFICTFSLIDFFLHIHYNFANNIIHFSVDINLIHFDINEHVIDINLIHFGINEHVIDINKTLLVSTSHHQYQ